MIPFVSFQPEPGDYFKVITVLGINQNGNHDSDEPAHNTQGKCSKNRCWFQMNYVTKEQASCLNRQLCLWRDLPVEPTFH